MSPDEIKQVASAMAPLINLDAQLSNLKKRIPLSRKEVSAKLKDKEIKEQHALFKQLDLLLKACEKLIDAAIKAVGAILNSKNLKAKLAALPMADAKKLLTATYNALKPMKDQGNKLVAYLQDKAGEFGKTRAGMPSMDATVNYHDYYITYLKSFKDGVGKLA